MLLFLVWCSLFLGDERVRVHIRQGRGAKDEQRGGGVGWCGLGTFVHLESFIAGSLELARPVAGQPGRSLVHHQTRVPAQVCAKWDVNLPLPAVLLWTRHPERAYWQPNQGKLDGGRSSFCHLSSSRVKDQTSRGKLHRSMAANFCGTFVCAAAGTALMRTAHVALYFGELFTILFPVGFSSFSSDVVFNVPTPTFQCNLPNVIISTFFLSVPPIHEDCIDTRDWVRQTIGVWFCLGNAFTKGARTAAVPTS
ncbi:hypothetical protein MCOR14_003503 [Pyricularia oryzae]|nr:hypothetical protein MCOR06_009900 [Pyricularia oryzae]KAI6640332.1 hypothetical protein MCOR14_003503 [Pyricularia oryzae]